MIILEQKRVSERCLEPQDLDRHEVMKESLKRYEIKLKMLLMHEKQI